VSFGCALLTGNFINFIVYHHSWHSYAYKSVYSLAVVGGVKLDVILGLMLTQRKL